jgi:hypothetical protein
VALYPDTRPPDYSGSVQALPSAQSSESVTPDVNLDHASARWLNLLATDAAQAGDFSLPASAPRTRLSRGSVSHYHEHASTAPLYSPRLSERQAWQADSDIALSKHEAALFRRFAEHIALPVSSVALLGEETDY